MIIFLLRPVDLWFDLSDMCLHSYLNKVLESKQFCRRLENLCGYYFRKLDNWKHSKPKFDYRKWKCWHVCTILSKKYSSLVLLLKVWLLWIIRLSWNYFSFYKSCFHWRRIFSNIVFVQVQLGIPSVGRFKRLNKTRFIPQQGSLRNNPGPIRYVSFTLTASPNFQLSTSKLSSRIGFNI